MTGPTTRSRTPLIVAKAALLGIGVPLAVAIVGIARRPEVWPWLVSRTAGYWLIAVVALLCLGATAAFLAAELPRLSRRSQRRLLKLAGLLLCLLPALIAILVGPMAIAFMYAAAG